MAEVVRKMGIRERIFYRWKGQYTGMDIGDIRRLEGLEEKNRELKQVVTDVDLDNLVLQDVLSKRLYGLVDCAISRDSPRGP